MEYLENEEIAFIGPVGLNVSRLCSNGIKRTSTRVVILQNLPTQYQCTYKGEIAGAQGNWLTGYWTSNKNLALGARNDLRNEAAKLGANVVVISETLSGTDESNELKNVTHIGRAYVCRK